MTERPILFSAPMVRILLAGTKTQTRRIAKPQHPSGVEWSELATDGQCWWLDSEDLLGKPFRCPYGVPGDTLWVREAHYLTDDGDSEYAVYAAEERSVEKHLRECREMAARHPVGDGWFKRHTKLRPSIHMPRWASRITLRITDVRVERLNDISEADAKAEGITEHPCNGPHRGPDATYWTADGPEPEGPLKRTIPVDAYKALWEEINGDESWDENPWVWAISFEMIP